jgi:hypothetical protein
MGFDGNCQITAKLCIRKSIYFFSCALNCIRALDKVAKKPSCQFGRKATMHKKTARRFPMGMHKKGGLLQRRKFFFFFFN